MTQEESMKAVETEKYKDLGWANGWKERPKEVSDCREQKHEIDDFDIGPPRRGLHHVVICHKCKTIYHYDSSD